MEKEQVNDLLLKGIIPGQEGPAELIETHISWILLTKKYAYKIKRPVHYSFLDFSSLERRKYFCEREIVLNKRLTRGIYLDVQRIGREGTVYAIGSGTGETVDYTVRMNRMNREKQMDVLLGKNQVFSGDIVKLAKKIAAFHMQAEVIFSKDLHDIRNKFRDLEKEITYLRKVLPEKYGGIISDAIEISDDFNIQNLALLESRLNSGFIRDCHGDLHTRNIFLLPEPEPFDCIEFNDDFRQIDVLNEVAFLCMDLDAFGRADLSEEFIENYNELFPTCEATAERRLFIYYKLYRANIRAKINSLRARSSDNPSRVSECLAETKKYLDLMKKYLLALNHSKD